MNKSSLIHLFSIHYHYINGRYNDDIYSPEYDIDIKTNIYPNINYDIQLEITQYYLENVFCHFMSDTEDIYEKLMSIDIEIIHIFILYFEKIFKRKNFFINMIKEIYFPSSKISMDICQKCNLFFEKINLYKENNCIQTYLYDTSGNLILDLFDILELVDNEYIVRIINNHILHFYKITIFDYFQTNKSVDDIYQMTIRMNIKIVEIVPYIFNLSQNKFEDYIRFLYMNDNNISFTCLKAKVFLQKILLRIGQTVQ